MFSRNKAHLSRGCRRTVSWLAILACLSLLVDVSAVINVGLQPADLFERYEAVFSGRIDRVDRASNRFWIRIDRVHKGAYNAGDEIEVTGVEQMAGALANEANSRDFKPGAPVVAFAGKRQRRREQELLFYLDGFYLGVRETPQQWRWTAGDTQIVGTDGQPVPTMLGTWNGSTAMLSRMMDDLARGTAFFPRRGYARFKPDLLIDQLSGPVRGVGLHDLDGDGRPDIVACSPSGDRVYLQLEPMEFVDATTWLGLSSQSTNCSIADVDGDGAPDLLLDGRLYRNVAHEDRRQFRRSERLPAKANDQVHASRLADVNGDGWADVIISHSGGGLAVYLNSGDGQASFRDATAESGLDRPGAGAGGTGTFACGDWNGDGRLDLFYAAGTGLLLLQDRDGRFTAQDHDVRMRFTSGEREEPGLTGAGVFGPILGRDRLDLVVPIENGWHVIENRAGTPVDVTGYGNEISEGSNLHLATVLEDLTLDGHLDLFTVSRARNGHNRFIINRGYGSFMLGTTHRAYDAMFTGPALELGGWGVSAGDVDGDGQPDLLWGNEHGHLVLALNDTLSERKPIDNAPDEIARMLRMRRIVVDAVGTKGVAGAHIVVRNEAGDVVATRVLGGHVPAGNAGPAQAIVVVPTPGTYRIEARFTDGKRAGTPIEVKDEDAAYRVQLRREDS